MFFIKSSVRLHWKYIYVCVCVCVCLVTGLQLMREIGSVRDMRPLALWAIYLKQ